VLPVTISDAAVSEPPAATSNPGRQIEHESVAEPDAMLVSRFLPANLPTGVTAALISPSRYEGEPSSLSVTWFSIAEMDHNLEVIQTNFRSIYLDGIPKIIADGTAFLAFVCIIAATEALCGYRYGDDYDTPNIGKLFRQFLRDYYPGAYGAYLDDLWVLRNKLVHAFSTGRFLLTHHHPERHLMAADDWKTAIAYPIPASVPPGLALRPSAWTGAPIDFEKFTHSLSGPPPATGVFIEPNAVVLNAEDFYTGLLLAAEKYFAELATSPLLQQAMRARLSNSKGGPIGVQALS
jgi:hypothetical protein